MRAASRTGVAPRFLTLEPLGRLLPSMCEADVVVSTVRVVRGERMLLHQATEQMRLMTGRVAPVAEMDRALLDALG